jgi:nitrite reductase (NO-forming)
MHRSLFLVALFIAVVIAGAGAVGAQDQATPGASASPILCASPVANASATPVIVTTVEAAGAAASPGGLPAGQTVGLYPCDATPSSTGQGATAVVTMVDINFQPKEITIAANTDVAVSLPNQGAAVHNFNVDALNIHSGDVQPGQTGSVTINAAPGDYQYYCSIPGHKEAGMIGTLHVQ